MPSSAEHSIRSLPSRLGVRTAAGWFIPLPLRRVRSSSRSMGGNRSATATTTSRVDRVAEGFAVAARSGEIVEAIEHRSMPVAAVQYHPERMTGRERFAEHGPDTAPLFAWFVRQCMGEKRDEGKIAQSL